jgi:ABC-type proline/glycine betaine transport system ATPase subunit
VYRNGALKGTTKALRGDGDLLAEVIDVFELEPVLNHGLTGLSKGEIQRTLLAFSLLYGSASCFMDEPLFAMEEAQKEKALAYLKEYAAKTGTAIFISMHEIALSRRYAETILLFYPDRTMEYGTPEEVLTDAALEKAYGVPVAMLKHSEDMTRETLLQTPISVSVKGGFVTDISGGAEAKRLLKDVTAAEKEAFLLETAGKLSAGSGAVYSKNARNIGELGIGLNPAATITGNMLEDEKAFRTCHFAIGQNYDDDAPALIHFDGVVRTPTVTITYADGSICTLLRDGELQL